MREERQKRVAEWEASRFENTRALSALKKAVELHRIGAEKEQDALVVAVARETRTVEAGILRTFVLRLVKLDVGALSHVMSFLDAPDRARWACVHKALHTAISIFESTLRKGGPQRTIADARLIALQRASNKVAKLLAERNAWRSRITALARP
jgi:hypothetical protein